ncbi:MAG: inositol monophosphatase [Planctomycetota bacterium]
MPSAAVEDPRELQRIARRAVERAGRHALEAFQNRPRSDVEEKARGDFVTEIDRQIEAELKGLLLDATPRAGFVGEESERLNPSARVQWVVDPIDGTSNFAQGLRLFAVSIGALVDQEPVAGACWTPDDGIYDAAHGHGAFLDGRRLVAPAPPNASARLIACQWFRAAAEDTPPKVQLSNWFAPLIESGARLRSLGSTVLQVLHTAAGRYHANLQPLGRVWDLAAVAVIAREAGLNTTTWEGEPLFPGFLDDAGRLDPGLDRSSVIAADPLHSELLDLLGAAGLG